MSANNILIIEEQKDGSFIGYDRSAEGEYREGEGFLAFVSTNERAAIEAAQEYMKTEIVEYGFHFLFRK